MSTAAIIIAIMAVCISAAAFGETRRANRRREQAHLVVTRLGAHGDGGGRDHLRIKLKNVGESDAVRVRLKARVRGEWGEEEDAGTIAVGGEGTWSLSAASMSVMILPTPGGPGKGRWVIPDGTILLARYEDRRGVREQRIRLQGEGTDDLLAWVVLA